MSQSASSISKDRFIVVMFFVAAWILLSIFNQYHLIFKEQITLLCLDASYIHSIFVKPAAVAVLFGDLLTQFFIFPFAAQSITILAIVLFWDGIRRFLCKQGIVNNSSILALLPAATEICLSCQSEYPLSMTIGAAIAVWSAFACSCIKNKTIKWTVTLLLTLLIFPFAGAHALLFILLTIIDRRREPLFLISFIAVTTAVLFFECRMYTMMPAETFCYPIAFGYTITRLYIFTLVEGATMIAFLIGVSRLNNIWCESFLAALVLTCGLICFSDKKQEYDLKLSTLAYREKWDKVKELSSDNLYQTQTGAYYSNVCSSREGQLPDDLLTKYQPLIYGLFLPVSGDESYIKIFASIEALLEVEDYNQAQHSAMIGMTFSPRQCSSRMVHRLAEIAIYNSDTKAASRYLGILEKTLFYRNWAKDAKSLLDEQETLLNHTKDTVYKVNDYQVSLRNIIESNPFNIKAIDYLLCFDLLQKEIMTFKKDYDSFYFPLKKGLVPPRIYQEALEMLEAEPCYMVSAKVQADNQEFLNGNELPYKDSYWFYFKYAQRAE